MKFVTELILEKSERYNIYNVAALRQLLIIHFTNFISKSEIKWRECTKISSCIVAFYLKIIY